jgi:hypothetical protein
MTFLEMCQLVVLKTGISGTLTSVTGRTGELARVVNWVNEAWFDIQRKNSNWDWMRYDFSFNTVANDDEYTPAEIGATNFRKWHQETFRIYETALGVSDEQFLPFQGYSQFRDTYRYSTQIPGRPSVFTVLPRGSNVILGVLPSKVYTVRGEYQRKPTLMAANTDVPDMPDDFHMGIVHLARMKYAMFENAPEVMAEAQAEYNDVMSELAALHTPDIDTGNPLA